MGWAIWIKSYAIIIINAKIIHILCCQKAVLLIDLQLCPLMFYNCKQMSDGRHIYIESQYVILHNTVANLPFTLKAFYHTFVLYFFPFSNC